MCTALLVLIFHSAVAAEGERYEFRDRGQRRVFELAHDEIFIRDHSGDHRIAKFSGGGMDPKKYAGGVGAYKSGGEERGLVLYEAGKPRSRATRRVVTRRLLVKLRPGMTVLGSAAQLRLKRQGVVGARSRWLIYEAADSAAALEAAGRLRDDPEVVFVSPMLAVEHMPRVLPDDPFRPDQWHLENRGLNQAVAGMDLHVVPAWEEGWTGSGVVIGIVDDGVEYTHPDLAASYDETGDWNFNYDNDDPFPSNSERHGTAVAGVAAATGNNQTGVTGVAYAAGLVSLKVNGGPITDESDASAVNYRSQEVFVKNYSWGPSDDGKTVSGPGVLMGMAIEDTTLNGRAGRGTIHVWAGGNGRANGDNANYDGYVNSIYTIGVAALGDQGTQAHYSEPGACLIVTAPSQTAGRPAILTTDRTGSLGYNGHSDYDYTDRFNGTSASAPMVAGVAALMLEANPALHWRDVQEILVASARQVDSNHSGWRVNGAGYHFNPAYGAGLVDTLAAVHYSQNWISLGPETTANQEWRPASAIAIPDGSEDGVVHDFDFAAAAELRVEHVRLTVEIDHSRRGDLEIEVISPEGTVSPLAEEHDDPGDDFYWTFMSVFHWGESSTGTWTVRVRDRQANGETGVLHALALELRGSTFGGVPATGADVYAVAENGTLSVADPDGTLTPGDAADDGVRTNDSDPDGDPLTVYLLNPPAAHAGTFSLNADGTFEYRHDGSEEAEDSFTYFVTDGQWNSPPREVVISVAPVNDPPLAVDDAYTVAEGGTLAVAASGVLENDVDVDLPGDALSVQLPALVLPAHGELTLRADGSFDYVHDGSETLADAFQYRMDDGHGEVSEAVVDLTIQPVNDLPVLSGMESTALSYTENEAALTVTSNLLLSDADNDAMEGAIVQVSSGFVVGDRLVFTDQNGITGNYIAEAGVLNLAGTASLESYRAAMCSVQYRHAGDNPGSGPRTISFRVFDGSDYSTAAERVIEVTAVNDAPVAMDSTRSGFEDLPVIFSASDFQYADPESDGLDHIQLVSLPAAGTLLKGGEPATVDQTVSAIDLEAGLLAFVSAAEASGVPYAAFQFRVHDGLSASANQATMTLEIQAVNDAPELTGMESTALTYTEGGPELYLTAAVEVGDVDSSQLAGATVAIVSGFAGVEDELLFSDLGGITGIYNTGNGVMNLSGSASLADYQSALRSVRYINHSQDPDSATREIRFKVNDGMASSVGVSRDVGIVPVNSAPETSGLAPVHVAENNAPVEIDLKTAFSDIEDSPAELDYALTGNTNPSLFDSTGLSGGILTLDFSGTAGMANLTVRATDTGMPLLAVATELEVVVDTMLNWREEYFDAASLQDRGKEASVWGDTADPDHDGRQNLMEFALGLNPVAGDADAPRLEASVVVDSGQRYHELTFYRRLNDSALSYTPETLSDAQTWIGPGDLDSPLVLRETTPVDAEFERVTWRDTTPLLPGQSRAIRLRVNRP